jgi:hypothetical protein
MFEAPEQLTSHVGADELNWGSTVDRPFPMPARIGALESFITSRRQWTSAKLHARRLAIYGLASQCSVTWRRAGLSRDPLSYQARWR